MVLVSSDQNEAEHRAYLGNQPWLAVPFLDRARKEALSKRYKVAAIPTLVAVGSDGALINADCRWGSRAACKLAVLVLICC